MKAFSLGGEELGCYHPGKPAEIALSGCHIGSVEKFEVISKSESPIAHLAWTGLEAQFRSYRKPPRGTWSW